MVHASRSRLAAYTLGLACLPALACSSESSADSAACRRYKAALLAEQIDTEFTTPAVDGSYDAYRCPTEDEFVPQGEATSLAACAEYLERLNGAVPLGKAARPTCKIGVLIWVDRAAQRSSDDVGSACQLDFTPPDLGGDLYLEWQHAECGEGGSCASAPSGDSYCTCRCDADGAELPVCACPDGFACQPDVVPEGGDGARGGYCIRN